MQLVPRGLSLLYTVGSSGKIRAMVVWKEKCAPELVPELCLLQEVWAQQGLAGEGDPV